MVGDSAVPLPDTGFEVVRRGYDQAQVDLHLRRIDADIRILVHDRAAAADQADQLSRELEETRARAERLRAQVRTLVSPPQSVQGMSDRMRSMLRLAEDEVAEMIRQADAEVGRQIRDAERRAEKILADARAEAESTRAGLTADIERSVQEAQRMRAEIDEERRSAMAEVAAATEAAERERTHAWIESENRRSTVEGDFALAMDQRRSEALATLSREQLDARRAVEAQREKAAEAARASVAQAQQQARLVVTTAERRVTELTALRGRIVEQLGGTRAVLERGLVGLEPMPQELQTSPSPMIADVDGRGPTAEGVTDAHRSAVDGGDPEGPVDEPPAGHTPPPSPARRSPSAAGAGRL